MHNYTGKIYLDNKNIQKIHTDTLRKNIVYINQRTTLLDGTVIKNMMYGNRQSQSQIVGLLKRYDLLTIFSGLKKGVYERVLMSGTNLSLGMQKVIILVRGILKAQDSKIIFFDEPLAGLDQISRTKVIKMILTECVDNTIIIITHDKEIIPYMDKVYNMNEINKL